MKLVRHSFSSRLTRRIFLTVLVTMVFITGLIALFAMILMYVQTTEHYESLMDVTNERVDKVLTAVEVSAANNVDEIEEFIDSPENVFAALEKELKLNPHVIGCAAAFKPFYYPKQGQWFEPYVVRLDSTRIEKRQIGSEQHDYHKSPWFVKVMETKEPYWSDPYYDDIGAKMMLCSYVLPLHDDTGEVVGVFVADVSLDWIKTQMREIDNANNKASFITSDSTDHEYKTHSFILGRNGEFIVHHDDKKILTDNYYHDVKTTPFITDDSLSIHMQAGKKGYLLTTIDSVESYVFYSPLERVGWSMAIVVPQDALLMMGYAIGFIILVLMGVGLLMVFLISYYTIRNATKPLSYLSASANQVAKGIFDTPLPTIKHDDEIRLLRDSFEEMQNSLTQYVEQLKTTTAQKASLDSELKVARNIQMAMLPKVFPPFPERDDIDIYGFLTPAKAVGGDFYDFYIRDEKLFFCIGDVSGKGVPASLVMAVLSVHFRTLSANESQPDRIVAAINEALSQRNEWMMFATFFVGVLDLGTGQLHYSNAGHNAPLVISHRADLESEDGRVECEKLDVNPNAPIGVLPGCTFSLQQRTIAPGTSIFLYTDGLTEAEDKDQALFGEQRMMEAIKKAETIDPKSLITTMTDAIHQFVGEAEQSDDLTMLAIRFGDKCS